jgi:hypothetical protein
MIIKKCKINLFFIDMKKIDLLITFRVYHRVKIQAQIKFKNRIFIDQWLHFRN